MADVGNAEDQPRPFNDCKTLEPNERADVFVEIYKEGYRSFGNRRAFEWKLALGIWTALAVFIGFCVQGKVSVTMDWAWFLLPAALILVAQGTLGWRIHAAGAVDKRRAERAERCLDFLTDVSRDLQESKDLDEAVSTVKRFKRWKGVLFHNAVLLGITAALMVAAGLALHGGHAPPTTRPVVTVDNSVALRHVIGFTDGATPVRTALPEGVMGAEIWVKIGDPPPVDPSELTFLGTDTRTPYVATYPGADANKVAHYMLRWINTRGEKGPWSETASATIGA
jgi:hypothetical protein